MQVFISWSLERSQLLANALCHWLSRVIQELELWISDEDILKGQRWSQELAAKLESTDVGVLCITRENANAPWILYEAGALSKRGKSRVIPYLLDLTPGELPGPLQTLNAATVTKDETLRLVASINKLLPTPLADNHLADTFELWWPKLEEEIHAIPPSPKKPPAPPKGEELLAQISERLARLEKLIEAATISAPARHMEAVGAPEDDTLIDASARSLRARARTLRARLIDRGLTRHEIKRHPEWKQIMQRIVEAEARTEENETHQDDIESPANEDT